MDFFLSYRLQAHGCPDGWEGTSAVESLQGWGGEA